MKAEVIGLLLPTASAEICLSHGDASLAFSASCFGRRSFQQEFGMFDQINAYWATYSEREQGEIFEIYRRIAVLFSTASNRTSLMLEMNKEVVRLLDYHDFERAYQWVVFSSDIAIPDNFDRDYVHSIDKQGSREQTYIRADYTKLITLGLLLRTMIPVWGEFISNTWQETGTLYKEYYAFQLLNHSKMLHTEPFEKLFVYIDKTVGDDRANPSTIIEGISSEDFTTWMMALVVIRRLCIGDIRGQDQRANMVTFIHRYVSSKMKGSDIAADSIVKEKTYDDGGGSRQIEDKLSALERYKIKHDISLGEIMELEYSLANIYEVAFRLSANMSVELLDLCMANTQMLAQHRILDPQVMLLRWIMKPAISPRGLMYLSRETIVRAFGLLQAVLWARGHQYLALLSTSFANVVDGEMHISGNDSRQRIPKELQSELDRLYPYSKIMGGKRTGQKLINLTVKSIETLADNLSMFSWTMTAHETLITEAFGNCNTRRIAVPSDIKIRLAKLVVELGDRKWI